MLFCSIWLKATIFDIKINILIYADEICVANILSQFIRVFVAILYIPNIYIVTKFRLKKKKPNQFNILPVEIFFFFFIFFDFWLLLLFGNQYTKYKTAFGFCIFLFVFLYKYILASYVNIPSQLDHSMG